MFRYCLAILTLSLMSSVAQAAPTVQQTTPQDEPTVAQLFLSADGSCAATVSPTTLPVFEPQPLPRVSLICGVCSATGCVGGTIGSTTCHVGTVRGVCSLDTPKCTQDNRWKCFCNIGQ
jgi:hypothetical protein